MPSLYKFSEAEMLAFALVLLRISSFVVAWPLYSVQNVPHLTKILFALLIAMILFPVVGWQKLSGGWQSELLIGLILKEVCTGLMIGYITRLFFFVVAAAGELMSVSMGISSAQLLNPTLHSSSTALEQFKTIIASLIFLSINGHHIFLQGLVKSFETLPLYQLDFHLLSLEQIMTIGRGVLEASLRIAAPVVVSILFLNVGMGVIGRAVPQINILSVGLPLTIFGGFMVVLISLPIFGDQMIGLMQQMSEILFSTLKTV